MTIRTHRLIAALAFAASFVATQSSRATEPQNDLGPWQWWVTTGDLTIYNSPNAQKSWAAGYERIDTSNDLDHEGAACNGRTVKAASITFSHAAGDIDMNVYDIAGNFLGYSHGVSNQERVDVSAFGQQLVVIEAYGYNGATNDYGVLVECN
jgi:hypothetical protein